MNPFIRIFLGVITGSFFIIFIATRLLIPINDVSASAENNDEINLLDEKPEITQKQNCSLPSSYPENIQRWFQLIGDNASKYSIEAKMLAAIMLQESGGNPDAYSKSGAVGLMQVMPRDGIAESFMCINGPCFTNRPAMDELFDPQFNLEFSSRMLSNLFEKHGNWRDALRSYGPMDMGYGYADIVLSIYKNYQ
jgi:soluble lytic murein transglycosylase-like protein